jgi:hypothetical protein
MIDLLILLSLVIAEVWLTIYLGKRGLRGLREHKIVTDRAGTFTGKDAVSVARIYLFFAVISLVGLALFLFLLVVKLIHLI